MKNNAEQFKEALLASDRIEAEEILTSLPDINFLDEVVVPALEQIGREWENGDIALTQVYMSGRICEDLIDSIFLQKKQTIKEHPSMAILVLQDYHMLGKRIVSSILKANGYICIDYGGGVTVDELLSKIIGDKIEIVLISVLMLNAALQIKVLRQKLNEHLCNTKIVVGGAPFRFDPNLWKEVGADAMATNASDIIPILTHLIEEMKA